MRIKKGSIKGRIHALLIVVGVSAAFLTGLITVLVFYNLFQKQVFSDLKNYSVMLSAGDYLERVGELAGILEKDRQRVTIVNPKGEVLFDSNAGLDMLDNHGNRPEILAAAQTGEGRAVRHSDTLRNSTYYYARKLPDGNIIRIALQTNDAMEVFSQIFPVLLGLMLVILFACLWAARSLTGRIVRPIEEMAQDISHIEENAAYEELVPFSKIIREQHEDIRKKMLDLEKSSRIRQDFTANVSHELKTPLTVISGYAELLEQGIAKPEDIKHFGDEIHRNASRLLALINDIIQLAELDGEETEPERTVFDLKQVAAHCVEEMQMKAKKHKVTMYFTGEEEAFFLNSSRDMVEEMLTNLCDNAIRYNKPQGSVVVSVERKTGEELQNEIGDASVFLPPETSACVREQDSYLKLLVKDTGIGIPKEHCERIFERFYRVDKSRSKATGGTGLGLAIVKHIAACSRAGLLLKSEVGTGTELSVWFREAD